MCCPSSLSNEDAQHVSFAMFMYFRLTCQTCQNSEGISTNLYPYWISPSQYKAYIFLFVTPS